MALGVLFVFAYNLELLGGRLHGDFWFALSWGAFPLLTAYFAQAGSISIGAVVAAAGAFSLSVGPRVFGPPARVLRPGARPVSRFGPLNDGSHGPPGEGCFSPPPEAGPAALFLGRG